VLDFLVMATLRAWRARGAGVAVQGA
jgi:hypothetical protein